MNRPDPTPRAKPGLSPRERIVILVGLGAALLIAVPTLLTAPASGKGGSLASEQRRLDAVTAKVAQASEELARLRKNVDARVSAASPRQLVQEMVQSAQAAARVAKLRIADVKPLHPEASAGIQSVPVELTLTSAFPSAVRFLYELQRNAKQFRVERLRLVNGDARKDRLDMDVRIVAYVRSAEEGQTGARTGAGQPEEARDAG